MDRKGARNRPRGGLPIAVGLVVLLVGAGFLGPLAPARAASPASSPSPPMTSLRASVGADPPTATIPVRLWTISFTAVGLPPGTVWSVWLDGARGQASSSSIAFQQPANVVPYRYWVSATGAFLPTPATGTIPLTGGDVTIAVHFAPVPTNASEVNFTASGLPENVSWTLHAGAENWTSASSSLGVWLPNGTYNFSILPVQRFAAAPSNGSFTVAGRGLLWTISFTPLPNGRAVTVRQTGLTTSTNWSLLVNSTAFWASGPSLHLNLSPGVYQYAVPAVTGGLVGVPNNGSFTLNATPGTTTNLSLQFLPAALPGYAVTFTQSGLPSGTEWSITLSGQTSRGTGASIAFNESNGTYNYAVSTAAAYHPTPASGNVTVRGAPTSVAVRYSTTVTNGSIFEVRFQESGLPPNASWTVDLGRLSNSSTGSFVAFRVANGSYPFTANASGYSASPPSGTVNVSGAASVAAPVMINFRPGGSGGTPSYVVTFTESGLPAGTNWSAELAGVRQYSQKSTISFTEPNGSYAYQLGAVAGAAPNISAGNVSVHGRDVSLPVMYASTASGSSSSGLMRIPAWGWAVIGLLVVIFFAGILLVFMRRMPPRRNPARR